MPEPGDPQSEADLAMPADIVNSGGAIDLALWQAASGADRVSEYLVYLERFPEGEFAALARERISALSEAAAEASADTAVALAFWESIQGSTNPAHYEAYLAKYPQGNLVLLAKTMLDELRSSVSTGD